MGSTFAVLNQKGGVGKTTVTLGLASAAAQTDAAVLVVDVDPQASATWILGIDDPAYDLSDVLNGVATTDAIAPSTWSESIDVLAGSAELQRFDHESSSLLREALEPVGDRYDAILLDCPPALGGLTRNALAAADHALVVVEPSALGLRGIGGLAGLVADVWEHDNPDLELSGVILNRVPSRSKEAVARIDELDGIVGPDTIWEPPIPQRVVFSQAVGQRRSIHSFGARAAAATEALDALWERAAALVAARS